LFQKFEATMINCNLEVFPKQVKTLDIHNMQNNQHFLFICGFSQVSLREFVTSKGRWSAFLHEKFPNAFPRGITLQNKSLCEVGQIQQWSRTHILFQSLDGLISGLIPTERIFLKEGSY
jgi:hypothetical protein